MKIPVIAAWLMIPVGSVFAQSKGLDSSTRSPDTGSAAVQPANPEEAARRALQAVDGLERRIAQLEAKLSAWERTASGSREPASVVVGSVAADGTAQPSSSGSDQVTLDISSPQPATMATTRPARSAPNPYGVAARKLADGQILLVYGGGEMAKFPNESEANAFIRRWHEELAQKAAMEMSSGPDS